MFFKNRNLEILKPITHNLTHESVIVPFSYDCSFELMFPNINKLNLNFTDKKIALMWSSVYSNLDNFLDSLSILEDQTLEQLNKNLIESSNSTIISASCFLLMFKTSEENLFDSQIKNKVDLNVKNNLKLLSKKKINFSFNKQNYNETALQDLKYLNDEEKTTLSKYKKFVCLTENENDLIFFDSCSASKVENYYLIWSKK